MEQNILVGLDIGATNTRILITEKSGKYIYHTKSEDFRQKEKIEKTITRALAESERTLSEVFAICAGVAGCPYKDGEGDELTVKQAYSLLDISGLTCKRHVRNDAAIAHMAYFPADQGIVAIAGTGSSIYGVNSSGVPHMLPGISVGGWDIQKESSFEPEDLMAQAAIRNEYAIETCNRYVARLVCGIIYEAEYLELRCCKLGFGGSVARNDYFKRRIINGLRELYQNRLQIFTKSIAKIIESS